MPALELMVTGMGHVEGINHHYNRY